MPFFWLARRGDSTASGYSQKGQRNPIPLGHNRTSTDNFMVSGAFSTFYDNKQWPVLTAGLNELKNHKNPEKLVDFSDEASKRDDEKNTYLNNSSYANFDVSCLDNKKPKTDPQHVADARKKAEKAFPAFGEYYGTDSIMTCENWDVPTRDNRISTEIKPSSPVVIVDTTNDPATIYKWAENLHNQIKDSTLVTYEGEGHAAFGRSSCVTSAVNKYFVDGTVPENNLKCDK